MYSARGVRFPAKKVVVDRKKGYNEDSLEKEKNDK